MPNAPREADLTDPRKPLPPDEPSESSDPVLRAKYLDYCSARVADALSQLTADEMYLLAQEASQELEAAEPLSYTEMVRLATDRLSKRLSLPAFPAWLEAYRKDPQHYEKEMLGLWESDLNTSDRDAE